MNKNISKESVVISEYDLKQVMDSTNKQDRYKALIQLGDLLPQYAWLKQDAYLISGCASHTWLAHWKNDQKNYFAFNSNSRVVSGLCALALFSYQGKNKEQIASTNLAKVLNTLGLEDLISASRRDGVTAIDNAIQSVISV